MHVEIQVALNFLISFLYNKLPRRRVNQFGEELEKALKIKFDGHWYPEKPFRGSAFRCLKTAPPLDPVFELAARESGMDLSDIQENLPQEMSIWVDPGEVSYRMGEKVPVKILYSESDSSSDDGDREISRTFNPEAQCFKPIDSVANQLANLSISPTAGVSASATANANSNFGGPGTPSPTYKTSTSPVNAFIPKSTAPLTFTTATFAQTKFGSTKLKTSSKRSHRMSPTEFSNYIKQRAILQQQQSLFAQRPRSPNAQQMDPNLLLVNQFAAPFAGNRSSSFGIFDNGYLGDLFSSAPGKNTQRPPAMTPGASRFSPFLEKSNSGAVNLGLPTAESASASSKTTFGFDGVNFNLNSVAYPNQYQHLLVAN